MFDRNDRGLQFYNAVNTGSSLLFSVLEFNGLFKLSDYNKPAQFVGFFPNAKEDALRLHRTVLIKDDELFFIPFRGHNISVYSTQTGRMYNIPVEVDKIALITQVIQINKGEYLFIPFKFENSFFSFSIESKEICRLGKLTNEICKFDTGIRVGGRSFDFFCADIYKDRFLYLAMIGTNSVLEINLLDMHVTKIELSSCKIANLIVFKDLIYLTSCSGNSVICYNPRNNKEKVYIIETSKSYERAFYAFINYKETLLLLPFEADDIYRYDEKKDEWVKFFCISECREFKRDKGSNQSLFLGTSVDENGNLLLYPRSGNGMLKLNEAGEVEGFYPIIYSDEFRRCKLAIDSAEFKKRIKTENLIMESSTDNLESYISTFLDLSQMIN